MKNGICLKCKGTKVSPLHTYDRIDGGGTELKLVHYQHPENWLFRGGTYFALEAIACFDCGYVEFYMKAGEISKAESR